MQDGSAAMKIEDRDFIYAYIGEFLDESLSNEEKTRFERALDDFDLDDLPMEFRRARGQLQLALGQQFLSEELRVQLQAMVEDDAARANHEALQIEDMTRTQVFGHALRLLVLLALIGGAFYSLFLYLGPSPRAEFDPLETLMYESTVLVEEGSARLDFPTSDLGELQFFFDRVPGLEFEPPRLGEVINGWAVKGASVIDYDVAKILLGQFTTADASDDLFLYFYRGRIDDLPRSDMGTVDAFTYQAYSSDEFNMIAWQVSDDVSGLLVGRLGAEAMAEFAMTLLKTQ